MGDNGTTDKDGDKGNVVDLFPEKRGELTAALMQHIFDIIAQMSENDPRGDHKHSPSLAARFMRQITPIPNQLLWDTLEMDAIDLRMVLLLHAIAFLYRTNQIWTDEDIITVDSATHLMQLMNTWRGDGIKECRRRGCITDDEALQMTAALYHVAEGDGAEIADPYDTEETRAAIAWDVLNERTNGASMEIEAELHEAIVDETEIWGAGDALARIAQYAQENSGGDVTIIHAGGAWQIVFSAPCAECTENLFNTQPGDPDFATACERAMEAKA